MERWVVLVSLLLASVFDNDRKHAVVTKRTVCPEGISSEPHLTWFDERLILQAEFCIKKTELRLDLARYDSFPVILNR